MTTLEQAARQALEALVASHGELDIRLASHGKLDIRLASHDERLSKNKKAIKELRKALEQHPADVPETDFGNTVDEPVAIDGNTSDGYHTFNELYEFRKAYNAALFNEWAASGKCSTHKSWRHHDGKLCFGGGWFIVVAVLPSGQISNHYEAKDWDLFAVQETERALFEFDGHTGSDVVARLKAYKTPPAPQPARGRVVFPTMLRKMWTGTEVQAWLDENVNKEKNHG